MVDVDDEKLELMTILANKLNEEEGFPFKIIGSKDRRDVLAGADYVVTSPAIRREDLWEKDWEIIRAGGINQTYGENGGPGSLSHTLRNVKMMQEICEDIMDLAPGAMMINFTNPEARICTYFDRYTSLKFVGLCHQIYNAYNVVSEVLQINREDIDIKAAGINHFTWIYDIRQFSTGASIYKKFISEINKKPESYEPMSRRLYELYGMFPTAGDHHLAEFISFAWEYQGLKGRNFVQTRKDKTDALEWLRGIASNTREISEKIKGKSGESVADIIKAIETGENLYQVSIDIRNNGCIPNLPDDAIVEVPGVVSSDGIRGLMMKPLPEGIAAMIRQQMTIQQLSVDAAVKGDRKIALQAMLLDPVVTSEKDAAAVLEELLLEHKEYISENFFKE